MNLQQLYYFKAIAEMMHFTKAAEKLSITQSSLSHAMKSLETELKVELFARSGRNVVLTKYGQMLLPYVNESLAALESGVSAVRDAVDPDSGTISIDCFPSLAPFLPDLIIQYISETKRLNVHVQTNQQNYLAIRDHLLDGSVDLAFATKIDHPDIEAVPVGEHELVLLVPGTHRFADRESISLKELDGEEFVAYTQDAQIRRQSDEMFLQLGVKPKITIETAQDMFIYSLVAAAHGVAIAPYPLSGAPYNVHIVRLEPSISSSRTLYMLWNKSAYISPAAAAFRDFVIKGGPVFDDFCLRNHLCGR